MKPETLYNLLVLATIFCALCAIVAIFYSNVPASLGFAIASVALNYVAQDNKPDKPAEK